MIGLMMQGGVACALVVVVVHAILYNVVVNDCAAFS
jgi:type IV secretory pathway VirB3-like protein